MKRLLRIFELSVNEQRVVLIIMLVLLTIALIVYERRIHPPLEQTTAMKPKPSSTAVQTESGE